MRKVYLGLILAVCVMGLFFYLTDFTRRQRWPDLLVALQSVDLVESARDEK